MLDALRRRRGRGGGLRRLPADGIHDAAAGRAGRDQCEPRSAAGAFQEGDGLGAEDVGMAGELEQGDSGRKNLHSALMDGRRVLSIARLAVIGGNSTDACLLQ